MYVLYCFRLKEFLNNSLRIKSTFLHSKTCSEKGFTVTAGVGELIFCELSLLYKIFFSEFIKTKGKGNAKQCGVAASRLTV
jgi:hypothetical protein